MYKWCWDQKKKKETDARQEGRKSCEIRSECSNEKENVSPVEKRSLGIHRNSKHIFKTKNASTMDLLFEQSLEKYKMKKYERLRLGATIPKRIDFSAE